MLSNRGCFYSCLYSLQTTVNAEIVVNDPPQEMLSSRKSGGLVSNNDHDLSAPIALLDRLGSAPIGQKAL